MWNEDARSWEVENMKTTESDFFMKLVWKIHKVARGKGPLAWNWGAPHVKSF